MADMRFVVQGFLDLSKAGRALPPPSPVPGLAAAPAAPPPQASPTPEAPPAGTAGAPSQPPAAAGVIYDSTAAGVVPPLPLRQSVTIPGQARPLAVTEGVVEIRDRPKPARSSPPPSASRSGRRSTRSCFNP